MTTDNHTAISTGADANAATFNTPLGALDAAIGDIDSLSGTPASVLVAIQRFAYGDITTISDRLLKEWVEAGAYELTAITYDTTYTTTVDTATVKWPDGNAGAFAATTINSTFYAIDAYTITWVKGATTKTITQAAVTRDSNGSITAKPALTVA